MPEKHSVEVSGERVAAVHHEAESEKFIFFCHGFGSDKEGSYQKRCRRVSEEGWNAVRFDFRGNGNSSGDFIEQTLSSKIEDLKAVVDHFQPRRYVFFGSSFGGKVAFHASLDMEPEAVIGRAPVTYNEIMEKFRAAVEKKGEFTHHPGATVDHRFFDDFDRYNFCDVADKLDVPVAIFHGADDTTVHPEHSFTAAEELQTDIMLQKLKGEKHSFSEEAEKRMREQMLDWLDKLPL